MDLTITILAILPIGLMLVGLVLIWSLRFQERRDGSAWTTRGRIVRVLGILSLILGLFLAIGLTTHVFMIVIWLATAVILIGFAACIMTRSVNPCCGF